MTPLAASAVASVALAFWSSKADIDSRGVWGNGYLHATIGPRVVKAAMAPQRFRVLFPALLFPRRTDGPPVMDRNGASIPSWVAYHVLRAAFVFQALLVLATGLGITQMALAAALYGVALRYDYWSNSVDLLGASVAFAGPALGVPVPVAFLTGLVLGTGRETLFMVALLGTPVAVALGAGALLSHLAVRLIGARLGGHRLLSMAEDPGRLRENMRQNLELLLGRQPGTIACQAVWVAIVALALPAAPLLTVGVGAVAFCLTRWDEPRILTALVPAAAATLTGALR